MIKGQTDVEILAEMTRGRMREKIPRLQLALAGFLTEHHRFLLHELLDQIDFLDSKIFKLEGEIWKQIEPFEEAILLWSTIPGLDRLSAATLLAEIGQTWDSSPLRAIWHRGQAYARATMKVPAKENPANCGTGILGYDLCCAKQHGQSPAQRKPTCLRSSIAWPHAAEENEQT